MSTIISGKASKKKLFTIICIFFAIALLSFAAYAYNFKLDLNETLYWITHSKNPKTGTVVEFAPQLGDFFLYGLTFPFTLGVSFINMLLEILCEVLFHLSLSVCIIAMNLSNIIG